MQEHLDQTKKFSLMKRVVIGFEQARVKQFYDAEVFIKQLKDEN